MRQEFVTLAGKRYCYVDQAPKDGRPKGTLLCLHGFPDQWYGWETQITAWSQAGYRVIVPHMLGYGQSDKPSDPSAYSTKNLCRDLALLLDSLQLDRVVVAGHDWGAVVAWRFGLWYPRRTLALIALSTPYFPPTKEYVPTSEAAKRIPTFAYQEYFEDPRSTQEIDAALEVFIPGIFQAPRPISENRNIAILRAGQMQALVHSDKETFKAPATVVSTTELQRYIDDFKHGGMNGPLSYYRNVRARYDDEKEAGLPGRFPSYIPVLFIYGTLDDTCPKRLVTRMPDLINDVKIVPLEWRAHWLLYEAPERVNDEVVQFLDAKVGAKTEPIASVRL